MKRPRRSASIVAIGLLLSSLFSFINVTPVSANNSATFYCNPNGSGGYTTSANSTSGSFIYNGPKGSNGHPTNTGGVDGAWCLANAPASTPPVVPPVIPPVVPPVIVPPADNPVTVQYCRYNSGTNTWQYRDDADYDPDPTNPQGDFLYRGDPASAPFADETQWCNQNAPGVGGGGEVVIPTEEYCTYNQGTRSWQYRNDASYNPEPSPSNPYGDYSYDGPAAAPPFNDAEDAWCQSNAPQPVVICHYNGDGADPLYTADDSHTRSNEHEGHENDFEYEGSPEATQEEANQWCKNEAPLNSLSGTVYHDRDNDGLQDEGEEGIAGVVIIMTGRTDNGDSTFTRSVETNSAGQYVFDDLPSGMFNVTEVQPAGYLDGKDTTGTQGGTQTGTDTFTGVYLDPVDATGYNFGEIALANNVGGGGGNSNSKVNICHATGSSTNPYEAIRVDRNAYDGRPGNSSPDHDGHQGDFPYSGPTEANGQPTKDGDAWCAAQKATARGVGGGQLITQQGLPQAGAHDWWLWLALIGAAFVYAYTSRRQRVQESIALVSSLSLYSLLRTPGLKSAGRYHPRD